METQIDLKEIIETIKFFAVLFGAGVIISIGLMASIINIKGGSESGKKNQGDNREGDGPEAGSGRSPGS